MVKPFRADELLARVAALLRRSFPANGSDQLTVGQFHFDIQHTRLIVAGEEVEPALDAVAALSKRR